MEKILFEITNIKSEDYKNSWNTLKDLCEKALLQMSEEDVYKNDRQSIREVINILNVTEGAVSKEYLYRVFHRKKEHAIEAIKIYMKREKSNFKYGITV